ncbi:MAG: response regulator transcription factor [Gammaproteobacteria bacterium]|uniref:response regulator transcription factor n=1 Tax=Pseudomaricurvus alcaniphilus TaxID=1166482 RepID=UPI00140A92F2|nr:response regulator transcription factor [Pseudomaricurvus alcaniphilus]MBR9912041.1 response regulator transcription factor [Gammaproteobacteria bacterium]NHN37480.1 response regulator transcription factor [Pseudomaricurvus alcaniphilus]
MATNKLLLVDDDQELCLLLKEYLQTEGFEVSLAHDGGSGVELANRSSFDVIVLDIMMPVVNGLEALRKIREQQRTPVLMLTAKGETVDRIVGLEMGADDYLPKPCNPRELVARLRAILRRSDNADTPPPLPDELQVDGLKLHTKSRTAFFNDAAIPLTGAEFTVLELLMREAGEVISKESLTENALNRKLTPYDRSIDVHVSNIRKKLSKLGANKDLIINIRGAGYMLTRQ